MRRSILLLAMCCAAVCAQDKGNLNRTNYIVVQSGGYYEEYTHYSLGNAALLITDKKAIAELAELFRDNSGNPHICGYHIVIEFLQSANKNLGGFGFNKDCQEYSRNNARLQSVMRKFLALLENKPPHRIYNLKIPAAVEPDEVVKSFEGSGLYLMVGGYLYRHSSLYFSYSREIAIKNPGKWLEEGDANAEYATKKIKAIIDAVNSVTPVVETEPKKVYAWETRSGGGTSVAGGSVILNFKSGTDLRRAREAVERNGGKILNEYHPSHYVIKLIDASDDLEAVRNKVKGNKFVTEVYKYPDRR